MAVLGWVLYAAINIVTFVAFGLDKRRVEKERRRLPEAHLLLLALFGGALGAVLGQQVFRHKTLKQPFRALLIGAIIINIAVAVWVFSPEFRARIMDIIFSR
jgi:uncharacterized membrane protein YsdA (DUF1294 family)